MRTNQCDVLVNSGAIYLLFRVTNHYAKPLAFSNTFDLPGQKGRLEGVHSYCYRGNGRGFLGIIAA